MKTTTELPLYVGITDFDTADQSRAMLDLVPPSHRRSVMIGFMTSYHVLNSVLIDGKPSQWASVWMEPLAMGRVCIEHPKALNTLHYADYGYRRTSAEDLEMAMLCCGDHLDALQLDMIWPDPDMIDAVMKARPIPIILQVGKGAFDFDKIENDPGRLLRSLKVYGSAIQGVLLDRSMGRRKGLDASFLRPFVAALFKERPDLRIAVAGGLGPDSLHLVRPLMEEFPDLSIDAQARLRPSGDVMDPVDWDMAGRYLERALDMFP